MMKKLPALFVLALVVLATTSCEKLQARDNLNKGIKAFRDGRFDMAVQYFDTATKLDPELTNAELYLATAYAQQFIPGAPSDDNQKFAQNAIQTFEKVLQREPKNISAIAGLAGMYQNLQNFDKSREYYKMQTEVNPDDPVPYYAIGSTNWIVVANKNNPLPDDQKGPLIEEGLQYIEKAIEKNPYYDEAMAYKNLLLRQKAALTKDPAEAKRLDEEATEWFNKSLATQKLNNEKKAAAASGTGSGE
jgi:Tfp pilus assembly protein PilF